jgi:hypothetical protein
MRSFIIKLTKMRRVVNVAHVEEKTNIYDILEENLKERVHLKYLSVDDRITLKLILKKWNGRV